MKTPITYYGGKQRLASKICSMIPQHKIYVEPFFGGGAVFFHKHKAGIEVINDVNDRLINFYQQAQKQFPRLKAMIDMTLNSESMFYHAKNVYNSRVESNELELAWATWMITNGSINGSMHGGWKWCNGSSGSHTGIMISNKRKAFNQKLRDRLDTVQISCRDALRVIEDRDTENTFFYLDPPYPGSDQGHYRGYTHNDLFELLQVLSHIKGKFILSNYFSTTLKYHIIKYKWNYESIKMLLNVNNLRNGGHAEYRKEILVYNFDIQKTLFN